MHPHLSAVGIHGDMAQERRSEIVRGCLEGKYSVVVATNVLGRGLDLVTVRQVSPVAHIYFTACTVQWSVVTVCVLKGARYSTKSSHDCKNK